MQRPSMPDLSIILPFRASSSRVMGLAQVLTHLARLDKVELVLVEADATPHAEVEAAVRASPVPVRHLFIHDVGPFGKSRAVNVGFRATRAATIAVHDADVVVPIAALLSAAAWCAQERGACSPYDRIVDLDPGEPPPESWRAIESRTPRPGINLAGGVICLHADAFVRIGGFDERFVGWGGEDDCVAFFRLPAGGVPTCTLSATAVHLWHDRDLPDGPHHDRYADNVRLLRAYASTRAEVIAARGAQDARSHGSVERGAAPAGDMYAFRRALAARESGGDASVKNPWGCLGLYQFSMGRLCDLGLTARDGAGFRWLAGIDNAAFLTDPSLQEECFTLHCSDLALRCATPRVHRARQGSDATLSGLVAGAHLVGFEGLLAFLERGEAVADELGTPVVTYLEEFSGFRVDAGLERPYAKSSALWWAAFEGVGGSGEQRVERRGG